MAINKSLSDILGTALYSTSVTINTISGLSMIVNNPGQYSFGFTGFKVAVEYEEPDDFEQFVWETRKAAGIDEPPPERQIKVHPANITGQLLWSGTTLNIPAPRFHSQLVGVTSYEPNGSDESNNT